METNATRPGAGAPGAAINAIAWWKNAHRRQLELCNDLEAIADSLPSNINAIKCLQAARGLSEVIRDIHRFEEKTLFPTLSSVIGEAPDLMATIERLKFEHLADESSADDLTERLTRLGAGHVDSNMEALGYMLRGFFDALRRHIAFEREYFAGVLDSAPDPSP